MANEKKITKVQICVLMEMEDYLKLKRVYGKDGESRSELIQRMAHDKVKDIMPTKEELKMVREYSAEQYRRRMDGRQSG